VVVIPDSLGFVVSERCGVVGYIPLHGVMLGLSQVEAVFVDVIAGVCCC